jgi:hypothetical protein
MDERERRIGLNEAVFREVNERLRGLNEAFGTITKKMEIVCECADPSCTERITMSVSEYEDLRSEADRFAVVPGHVEPTDVETVVAHGTGWEMIRKRQGAPADLAKETSSRARRQR